MKEFGSEFALMANENGSEMVMYFKKKLSIKLSENLIYTALFTLLLIAY